MIEFTEGAVCYAGGSIYKYWSKDKLVSGFGGKADIMPLQEAISYKDFQLNEPSEGWFIPKSELDTEEKYNKVVEVFGLFGFKASKVQPLSFQLFMSCGYDFILLKGGVYNTSNFDGILEVKCTYAQLMAIGELKRKMDERESEAEPIELLSDESMQYKISNIGNMIHNISCSTENEETQDELGDHAFNLWDLAKQVGVLERKELNLENEKNNQIDATQFGKNEDGSMKLLKSNFSENPNSSEQVKNPSHYQLMGGVESIEIIARSMTQEQWKGFCLGNMLKYRIRAGKKDKLQQDIDKANFYGELYEMHKGKCYE